jgi:hypothetical protein
MYLIGIVQQLTQIKHKFTLIKIESTDSEFVDITKTCFKEEYSTDDQSQFQNHIFGLRIRVLNPDS